MADAKEVPAQVQDRHPGREHEMTPRPDYAPRFPGNGRLKDKVALVTGGDSGIARAVCVLFAREGARIAFVYLEEDRDAEETKAAVEAEGGEALAIRGDVRSKAFCEDAVRQTVARFGRLDVLINNAAIQNDVETIEDLPEAQLRATFETNVYGYFFMAQAALPHMKPGATMVMTTSVNAFKGNDSLVDYSATRGAAQALARSLASQLASRGVRVNAVAPGPVWTPFIPSSMPPEKVEGFGSHVPMGRPGQPWEIATCHLFLACDESSYVTGQTLHPNGGTPVGA
jgi:NAD(P)-dependent dehydrogenase (short-subunit alcohol dehydrogenase family)